MSVGVQASKAAVSFPELVSETRDVDRTSKVLCPAHDDHTPSCHVYPDGFKCFSCGAHGDHIDWLELVHNLTTAEAIRELERRAGGYVPPVAERLVKTRKREPTFMTVAETVLEAHLRRAARLDQMPAAMQGRGFSVDDLKALSFAAYADDAVFPITGPDGAVLALKRRYAEPGDGQRYRCSTTGHGCPPWCSPALSEHDEVLIVEGELNAMACALAGPELAVMGAAGTNGPLHLQALRGRTVYVYADGDEPGQKARDRWAAQALEAGAAKVFVLDPWPMDACDMAGRYGRAGLRGMLDGGLEAAQPFGATSPIEAALDAPIGSRLSQAKPCLGHPGARFSSGPKLGGKPCL